MSRDTSTSPLALPALTLAVLPFVSAAGTDDGLPAAETLLDRNVEATGGAESLRKHETRILHGTLDFSFAGHSFTARVEEHFQAPGKFHGLYESETFAQVLAADGKEAWRWTAGHAHGGGAPNLDSGNAVLLEGRQLERTLEKARLHGALEWRELYAEVETVGSLTIDGAPAWEVKVTSRGGEEHLHVYDAETGRLVRKTRFPDPAQAGGTLSLSNLEMETSYLDYREFDGVWLPTRVRTVFRAPGMEDGRQTFTYTEVEHDAAIPASLFEKPEGLD